MKMSSIEGEPFRDAKIALLKSVCELLPDKGTHELVQLALTNDTMVNVGLVRAPHEGDSKFRMGMNVQRRVHPEVEVPGEADAVIFSSEPVTQAFHSLAPRYRLPLTEALLIQIIGATEPYEGTGNEQVDSDIQELREIRRRIISECCDDSSEPRKDFDLL